MFAKLYSGLIRLASSSFTPHIVNSQTYFDYVISAESTFVSLKMYLRDTLKLVDLCEINEYYHTTAFAHAFDRVLAKKCFVYATRLYGIGKYKLRLDVHKDFRTKEHLVAEDGEAYRFTDYMFYTREPITKENWKRVTRVRSAVKCGICKNYNHAFLDHTRLPCIALSTLYSPRKHRDTMNFDITYALVSNPNEILRRETYGGLQFMQYSMADTFLS